MQNTGYRSQYLQKTLTILLTTPERARTPNLRFRRPMLENAKGSKSKDLQEQQLTTVALAYKQNPKTGQNETVELPTDLAEIVAVWPELPEHIKAAVKALVDTHKRKEGQRKY